MNKNANIFRRIGWVAVLALMLQVFLPVLHPAMAAGVGNGLRICSVAKSTDTGKAAPQKMLSCPICMSMHSSFGGFVPPQNIVLASVGYIISVVKPATEIAVVKTQVLSSAQPRAPPSLV